MKTEGGNGLGLMPLSSACSQAKFSSFPSAQLFLHHLSSQRIMNPFYVMGKVRMSDDLCPCDKYFLILCVCQELCKTLVKIKAGVRCQVTRRAANRSKHNNFEGWDLDSDILKI